MPTQMPCPVDNPMSAMAALERMAGRPISASEAYTGRISPHGTFNYGTVLQAPAVYDVRHRYGFNTAGARTAGATHLGGAFGGLFANLVIYALLFLVSKRWIADPAREAFARRGMFGTMNPNFFALALGAAFGAVATVTAQFVYRPMAEVPVLVPVATPAAQPQQQPAAQQPPAAPPQQTTAKGPNLNGWWQWS